MTKIDDAAVARAYAEHGSMPKAAKALGITIGRVGRALRRSGVQVAEGSRPHSVPDADELARKREAGASVAALAREYGVTRETIALTLRRRQIREEAAKQ